MMITISIVTRCVFNVKGRLLCILQPVDGFEALSGQHGGGDCDLAPPGRRKGRLFFLCLYCVLYLVSLLASSPPPIEPIMHSTQCPLPPTRFQEKVPAPRRVGEGGAGGVDIILVSLDAPLSVAGSMRFFDKKVVVYSLEIKRDTLLVKKF
jgi:hypothetical protein